jgi:hypothetical protein
MMCKEWKKLTKEEKSHIVTKKLLMGSALVVLGLIWWNYPAWMPHLTVLIGLIFIAKGFYYKSKK